MVFGAFVFYQGLVTSGGSVPAAALAALAGAALLGGLVYAGIMRPLAGYPGAVGVLATIAPGITLHKVGGHTRGMQIVRVATRRGWVVLGSDTAHFYANLEPGRPFPTMDNLPMYVEAQRTALKLASSPQHFIPGHDPLVMVRYPGAKTGVDGVARVDLAPKS